MSVDNSYNCFYPVVLQGLNNLVNAIDSTQKTSFKNFGRSELMGDVYIDNNARLAIGKTMDSTNIYYLDVSGNSIFRKELYTNFLRTTGALLIGNPANATQNLLTSLTIGSTNPFQENADNPSGGISNINIQTKRGGTLTLGNGSLNNGGSITISAGSQTITIGSGNGTTGGVTGTINIGSTSTTNYNLITNLCTGTSANVLNLGSATSTINLLGNITANSLVITPTLISYLSGLTGNIQTQLANYQLISGMSSYALLASPAFTGNPTATTQLTTDNSTRIATTAYVKSNLTSYAPLASPALTGNPTAPTQTQANNTTLIATTAFVQSNITLCAKLASNNNFTGICNFRAPNDNTSISIHNGLRNNTGNNLNNVAIGSCLQNSTTSDINFGIGNGVLNSITTGSSQNMGIGYRALEALTSGQVNMAFGFISGYTLTSGNWNTFFSVASGAGFSTGDHNFCMGFQTMASFNSPDIAKGTGVNRNLALGSQAITIVSSNVTDNVGIGFNALGNPYNTANARLQSSRNTCIGSYAGYGLDGAGCNNNVFIGYNTGVADGPSATINTNTFTNILALNTGVLSSPVSNCVYIGNSSITNNYLYGTLNIPNITFTGNLNSVSSTVFGYISGLTSSAQTQLNDKASLTANNSYTGTQTFTKDVTFNGVYTISYLYNTINYNSSCAETRTGGSLLFNNTSVIFQTNLPTSSVTPSSGTHLVNKTYADGLITNLSSASNTWTGTTNTFNSIVANSQYLNNVFTLTGTSVSLSSPYYKTYIVSSTVTSITLPTASSVIGLEFIFILANGVTTANITINVTSGSSDSIYTYGQNSSYGGLSSYTMGIGAGSPPNSVTSSYQSFKATQTNVWNVTSPTNILYNTPSLMNQNTFSAVNTFSSGINATGINLYNQNLTSCFNITSSNYILGTPLYSTYYINPSLTLTPTISLPTLASTQAGTTFQFFILNNTYTATISTQSTDTIILYNNSTSITPSTSVVMTGSIYTNLSFTNVNNAYWYVDSPSQIVGGIVSGSTNITQQNQYVNTAYNAVITATTFTMTSPVYTAYSFSLSVSCVITLATATIGLIGTRILFRRVGTTSTTTLTSASSNVYPLSSNTAGTTLLASGTYSVSIICLPINNSGSYGWFIAN